MGPRAAVRPKYQSPQATAAEAAGLRWLRVEGGPPIPEVHAAVGGWLVIDEIPHGTPNLQAAVTFGRRLAALHLAGAEAFGAPPPGGPREATIGTAPMLNEPAAAWPEWFASQRIQPYAPEKQALISARSAPASRRWRARPNHRRDCTATCGAATCCGEPTARCG